MEQTSSSDVIGFIGLGAMGTPICSNILKGIKALDSSQTVHVWNRTKAKAEVLVQEGATLHLSISSLVAASTIIFCLTFDDQSLKDTFSEVVKANKKDIIFISSITGDAEVAKAITEESKQHSIKFLSAPVFGRPDAARDKRLVWVVAGDDQPKSVVKKYMMMTGREVVDVGTEPYLANVQKLVGNFLIACTVEMLAEAQTLAEKNGLPRQKVLDFLHLMYPAPVVIGYASRMAADKFNITESEPGFAVTGGLKDVNLVRKLAEGSAVKLPIADIVHDHLERQAKEDKSLDWGSLVKIVRKDAGLL